jgi:hypothetical protein
MTSILSFEIGAKIPVNVVVPAFPKPTKIESARITTMENNVLFVVMISIPPEMIDFRLEPHASR